MCTSRTVLVICARMSTDCSATTVPLARSRTGTSRRSTVATVTGTAAPPPLAAACGALSCLESHQPPRPASSDDDDDGDDRAAAHQRTAAITIAVATVTFFA